MDVVTIANQIEQKIKEVDEIRRTIRERGEDRARATTDYDCKMAVTLMALKNGKVFDLGGETIKNPPASTAEKIARGICWKEKLDMERAEALYKSAVSNLTAVCNQMNALQSINRYLDRGAT